MSQEDGAPPALRCAASHALLREPARAADGFTYERAVAADWLLAAGTRAHAHTHTHTHGTSDRLPRLRARRLTYDMHMIRSVFIYN